MSLFDLQESGFVLKTGINQNPSSRKALPMSEIKYPLVLHFGKQENGLRKIGLDNHPPSPKEAKQMHRWLKNVKGRAWPNSANQLPPPFGAGAVQEVAASRRHADRRLAAGCEGKVRLGGPELM